MATPEQILAVRIETGDSDQSLPVMSDDEIGYFIDKNNGSIPRATIDTAKSLLFKLSYRTDETVDIISVKGSKTAASWIAALKLFLTNPTLNPVISSATGWAGNVSVSEMQANNANHDNYVTDLAKQSNLTVPSSNPFMV